MKLIKIFLSTIFFFIIIIFLLSEFTNIFQEIYDRKSTSIKHLKEIYKEQKINFEEFNEIQKGHIKLRFIYQDHFLYSHALTPKQKYINIIDYYNSRKVNNITTPLKADKIIWFFGGSTMQELNTNDELTIASTIAKRFKENDKNIFAANFGMSGFYSTLELIKFVELIKKIPINEKPDDVIFYHGQNDLSYTWLYGSPYVLPEYLSSGLSMMINKEHLNVITYSLEKMFRRSAAVFNYLFNTITLNTNVKNKEDNEFKVIDKKLINMGVNNLISNQKIANSICITFDIECHFILQPYILTKKNPTVVELEIIDSLNPQYKEFLLNYYETIKNKNKNYNFYDLSDAFDNDKTYTDYSDSMHIIQLSSKDIGNKIYETLYD